MEDKLYNDNFEKLISGHADDFKMYPDKKAWHGIYNHLHPGKRWPSAAMSTLLLATLLLVGHLNTNNDKKMLDLGNTDNTQSHLDNKNDLRNTNRAAIKGAKIIPINKSADDLAQTATASAGISDPLDNTVPGIFEEINPTASLLIAANNNNTRGEISQPETNKVKRELELPVTDEVTKIKNTQELNIINPPIVNSDLAQFKIDEPAKTDLVVKDILLAKPRVEDLQTFNETVLGKFLKARKNKMSWKLHLTPNFSFRKFSHGEDVAVNSSAALGPVGNNPPPARSLDHRLALGFELGGSMLQELNKQVKLTAGLQFNYVGYNIKAYSVHPVLATLILKNEITGQEYPHSKISNYSNIVGSNPVTLHNQQLQVSLPVGTEIKLFGDKNLQVNAGVVFQPSYVIAGTAYLPSVDKRNYIFESSLLRKWNFSTALQTFASFKAGSSLTMHIGPQVRYQLLSTYKDKYPAKEHLIDYGIKFGVSKTLK
ncbi:MAG: hypothetical protein ABIQ56_06110 [Chitinophagaceae bacterium]